MRCLRSAVLVCVLLTSLLAALPPGIFSAKILLASLSGVARAERLPIEPEEDNSEYILDLETNAYSRLWRESWDDEDNRLRLRLGSNNVRDWFIEEELKLSAQLLRRLRIRYYHGRRLLYSTDRRRFDVFEFEVNIFPKGYLSMYAKPTFSKTENTIGFMAQRRKAVNHFFIFFVEFPHFLTNYTESHSNPPGDVRTVFGKNPIRIGVDGRELIYPHIWLRLKASATNLFEIRKETVSTGGIVSIETGKVSSIEGYIEYVSDPYAPSRQQSAAGVEGALQINEKSKGGFAFPSLSRSASDARFYRASNGLEASVLQSDFETDPFTPIEEDTVTAWQTQSRHLRPFAWIVLTDRIVARLALRYEKRKIEWRNDVGRQTEISNWYLVPSVGVRYRFGRQRASIAEAGLAAQYREREELKWSGTSTFLSLSRENLRDHRFYVAYEYHFGPDKAVRIIESIDLDSEDWGQFSIHDHGFFQMQFGF